MLRSGAMTAMFTFQNEAWLIILTQMCEQSQLVYEVQLDFMHPKSFFCFFNALPHKPFANHGLGGRKSPTSLSKTDIYCHVVTF